ncbi:MAG: ABC transporter substrate-binding protein [Acidimicrobiales bacterium]
MTPSVHPFRRGRSLTSLLALLALIAASCSQRDDDDASTSGGEDGGESAGGSSIDTESCITDPNTEIEGDTIRLVSSYPQSGVTAAFSEIARGWQAYFDMVNADGGVDIGGQSYQIEWETRDDQYDAARTSTNIDELVGSEGDGAFAVFSVVGTANNLAVRTNLGDLCVPNLFAATGAPAWGNPDLPWTIGSTLSAYSLEAEVFAQLLEEENPEAQVAMLVQDDDFGRAYEETFLSVTEDTDIEVVQTERYAPGIDTDVSAQVTSLAASGADVFFNGATLLACPDALTSAASANWERSITWVSSTCLSKTLMGLAGEAGDGVYSIANIKDPQSPEWADDEAMQLYRDTVAQYQPEADIDNSIVAYGWTQGAVLVEALEAAEAPTRLAVMESVRNLDLGDDVGLMLPGTGVLTDSDDGDVFLGDRLNLVQYNFAETHFQPVGDVYDFEGETESITPEDLIIE